MEVCVNKSKPEAVAQLRAEGTGEMEQLLTSCEAMSPPAQIASYVLSTLTLLLDFRCRL